MNSLATAREASKRAAYGDGKISTHCGVGGRTVDGGLSGVDPAGDSLPDAAPSGLFPAFGAARIERIAGEIARAGFCRIDGALPPAAILEARRQAEAAVMRNGGEYVAMTGPDGLHGYLLSAIHADRAFADLLRGLYRHMTGSAATGDHVHQVLRCLQGETARGHADYLHYDSYVVTILIPLSIPAGGAAGDLVLAPDHRPIRRTYLGNAFEKLLFDRGPVQRWLWRRIRSGRIATRRLPIEPGALYVFGGYRGLHANLPSDPGGLRATLLYHYGNPHADSALRRWRGG